MIYKTCPICGANLDPGERCDCRERTETEPRRSKEKPPPVRQHQGAAKRAIALTPHIAL